MKKILIIIMMFFIGVIIPIKIFSLSTVDAQEKIDVNRGCNLTLNYYYEDYNINNINVKIYYVASVTEDFQYQLSSNFSKYSVKINGLTTEQEWQILKQTLNSYIEADQILETESTLIKDNKVSKFNLKPGLYLIKTEKIENEEYILSFDSFLINVPFLNDDGIWNYDINVYPKAEEYIPKYEDVTYKVIKEWNDLIDSRPKNIDVQIYKDENLVENIVLSSDNNWTYEWTTKDDGTNWTVVERNIPNGYDVSILAKGRTFIIINTDSEYKEENPYTVDNINLYLYLLGGSLLGIVLLVISLLIRKKKIG